MSADTGGWMDGRLTCDAYAVFDWLYMRVSGYGSSHCHGEKTKKSRSNRQGITNWRQMRFDGET